MSKVVQKLADVQQRPGLFPEGNNTAIGEDGKVYSHRTNFSVRELIDYQRAIETYEGPGEFAITDVAYAGEAYNYCRLHGSYGFYARDYGTDLTPFWDHLAKVQGRA